MFILLRVRQMLATAQTYFQLCFAALFLSGASNDRMTFKPITFLYVFHNVSLYDDRQTRKHHAISGSLIVFP